MRRQEDMEHEMHDPGQSSNGHFINFLQAAACADPGVYKGRERILVSL